MKKTKVALVEDHTLVREAFANNVRSFDEYEVSLVASNGKDFIDKLNPENKPEIILMDLSMPEMDGHEIIHWLSKYHPDIKILVVTMFDAESLMHLLKEGVRGFLKKDADLSELKTALNNISTNGTYYSQTITARLFNLMKNHGKSNSPWGSVILNKNEIAFLKLAATEMTYKEIANTMSISPRTIDNYRDGLFIKLSVKSRVGLVLYAMKSGIATLSL